MCYKVLRLYKTMYGLLQSLRVFSQLLMPKALEYGLGRCAADPCVSLRVSPGEKEVCLIVGACIDLILSGKPEDWTSLQEHMRESFPTSHIDAPSHHIGWSFRPTSRRKRSSCPRPPTSIGLSQGFRSTPRRAWGQHMALLRHSSPAFCRRDPERAL